MGVAGGAKSVIMGVVSPAYCRLSRGLSEIRLSDLLENMLLFPLDQVRKRKREVKERVCACVNEKGGGGREEGERP